MLASIQRRPGAICGAERTTKTSEDGRAANMIEGRTAKTSGTMRRGRELEEENELRPWDVEIRGRKVMSLGSEAAMAGSEDDVGGLLRRRRVRQ
ncbi:unnamed protein product [Sphagnum balticum]